MAKTINKQGDAGERKFSQLDSSSGGGGGAPGGNGGDGGAGGSSEGGGSGGNYSTISPGAPGTLQGGGNGGGANGGQGGATNPNANYMTGGQITANITGTKGGDGKSGMTSYGSGGGGGALGVLASGNLTITNNAIVAGGDGGASAGGPNGSSGNGGGGTGMVISGPATINIASAQSGVRGGSTAGVDGGRGGADGGGGAGVYFAGSTTGTNSLTNVGTLTGGNSAGGGGGAALVLTDGITVNNNGGTVTGGASYASSKGQKGPGAPGILILGDNNTVTNIVANSTIEGGESSDGSKTPPGILVQGNANTIVTASKIYGGADLVNKTQGNAIEFTGYRNTLEIQSGYDFGKSNVLYQEPRGGVLALGGSTNVNAFDLSSIGPLGSGTAFQGFFACEKRGSSTWVVSGSSSGIGQYNVAEGILRMIGSGDLSSAERVKIGGPGVLDISGVTTNATTLPSLIMDEASEILLGNKALTLNNGGDIEGTIAGNSGITFTGTAQYPLEFDLLSTCRISAGPIIVRGAAIQAFGATIIGDITVGDAGILSLAQATIIGGNVTVGANGSLGAHVGTLGGYVTKTRQRPAIIKGNLSFPGGDNALINFVDIFGGELDLSMLEVSGNVDLNSVSIGCGFVAPYTPGYYGLIHAEGTITGTPTPRSQYLPPNSKLRVIGNRVELVVS
jgi:hypothetical protein